MWIIQPNQQPEKEEKWDYNHSEKLLENLIQLQEKLFQGKSFLSEFTLAARALQLVTSCWWAQSKLWLSVPTDL